eukprot:GHVS01028745.1.p1 GENE.GHVS01028745.1~~GHVS01028745.1.p1  ORF type:complete len:440 (-),score=26.04 GHVS01028745.1:492-1811(-)
MARLTPRERVVLSAIRREKVLQTKGRHMHKRFRSWAQQRIRQYWLPLKVSLTADPALMDGQYLAGCMQKAASVRKHDLELWYGYCRRLEDIAHTMTPLQMAYAFYGLGKSRFLHERAYRCAFPYISSNIGDYHSHALMCICWGLKRVQIRDPSLLETIGRAVAQKGQAMRPADLIKICNVLAFMGVTNSTLLASLSDLMIERLETVFAQTFRNAIFDLSVCNLFHDQAKVYILTRFSKAFVCARPQHYRQAYQTAVAVRVLYPHIWNALPKSVRCFYIRLSLRRIPQMTHWPSKLHWEVSSVMAKMGIVHRNTFQWGCYWLDIGEAEERRNCWFVDGPSAFYTSTDRYVAPIKLKHRVLNDLGWNIRRVRWDDWIQLDNDEEAKIEFLRGLKESPPLGAELVDREPMEASKVKDLLKRVQGHRRFAKQQALEQKQTVQF